MQDYIDQKQDIELKHLLSDKAYEKLLSVKNKELLVTPQQNQAIMCGVIDVLLAYLYDWRATEFEQNCESHWTINKLSATLSCFVEFQNIHDVLLSFYRRALVFPLFRHIDLNHTILNDLVLVLQAGRKFVLKLLADVHRLFEHNNPKHLLNKLYIEDYCLWVQKAPDSAFTSVLEALRKEKLDFESLSLPDVEPED